MAAEWARKFFSRLGTPNRKIFEAVGAIYLFGLILLFVFIPISPLYFLIIAGVGAIFILPSNNFGLGMIIILTMVFERFFTLQPLIVNYETIYKIYPLDLIIGLTAAGWLLKFRKQSTRPKLFFAWPEWTILGFIILTTAYFLVSLVDLNSQFAVAFSTWKNYACYPLLYFLTIYSIQNRRQLANFCQLFLLGGILIIPFIGIGLFGGQGLWTEYTPLSTGGTRLLAGTHAFFLLLALIFAWSLIAFRRLRQPEAGSLVVWVWLAGIGASLMRHLWLAAGVVAVGLAILLPKKNRKIFLYWLGKNFLTAAVIGAVILTAISLFPFQQFSGELSDYGQNLNQRLVSIIRAGADTSINWRKNLWQSALANWLENPILGVGLGKSIPLEMTNWQTFEEVRNIHNSLLAILVQMGLVGLGAFLTILFGAAAAGWRKISADPGLTPYYLAIAISLTVFLFVSLFQPYFETNLTAIFFWLLLGLFRTAFVVTKNYNNSPKKL